MTDEPECPTCAKRAFMIEFMLGRASTQTDSLATPQQFAEEAEAHWDYMLPCLDDGGHGETGGGMMMHG